MGGQCDGGGSLLVRARDDPEAFGRFYDCLQPSVLAFFVRRTASAHTAAELTAETFAQALAGVRRYKPELGSGKAWLLGIATNQYRQYLRRAEVSSRARRRLRAWTPELTHDEADEIEAMVDFAPLVRRLEPALDQLTGPVRDAVVQRFVDELSYEEIARRGECTIGNARVRVARGLARLAALLEQEDT